MPSPFLQELVRDMRLRGYALRTQKTYLHWIRRYIYFIDRRHPADAGADDVRAFLTFLAADRKVAVNTQKVALNALVYLYQKFLNQELGELGFTLATKQRQLPTVMSLNEVRSGLRINECLRLRVQDIDFDRLSVTVRDGKGRKDRQPSGSAGLSAGLGPPGTLPPVGCMTPYQGCVFWRDRTKIAKQGN